MKYRHKCKEMEIISNQLIDYNAKYLEVIEEMNRKLMMSSKEASNV